jgi:serine/threonine-protein kinase
MTLSPGARLGAYEVLASIGAGGMGEVYRAYDARLDRMVAVKVLPESLGSDAEALSRFESEAKAVAALSHPNILSIHDFGRHAGTAYAVMELLEGETLRERLERGPLPQEEALESAIQIARGLSAAHGKGFIHRDLKPDNIFLTNAGHTKILDFGLAKRAGKAPSPDLTTQPWRTGPGEVMGTVAYMSPDQAKGLDVDHRTDIFSFGMVLHEMLLGSRPFEEESEAETMAAILRDDPPDLLKSGRSISPALARAVRRCLEKDPGERFQSAREMALALEDVASGITTSRAVRASSRERAVALGALAVLAVALAAASMLLLKTHEPANTRPETRRVAVLPFENVGPPEDDYFADGIADEVRGKLTSLPDLEVIARGSSTPYRKTSKTPARIARELGVRYLITATVRWEKGSAVNRVHVSPELVEIAETGPPVSRWQPPIDAALTDVFQVQSDIATHVARALGVTLGGAGAKRLSERPTQNVAAYSAFLKGESATKGLSVSDPPSLRRALTFYEEAVALDPAFAQAWAQVSRVTSGLYVVTAPTKELADRSRQAAERAVALAPAYPEGYLALGRYLQNVVKDPRRSLDRYEEGRLRGPGNAEAVQATGYGEAHLGMWDRAIEHLRQAERLDPRSASSQQQLGLVLMILRRYHEARETFDRGLSLAPANLDILGFKAMTYACQGDLAGAQSVLKGAPAELSPIQVVAGIAGYFDSIWMLDREQRELLLRLTPSAFDEDRGGWSSALAQAAAINGDAASARRYAEEARTATEEQLRAAPDDAFLHQQLARAFAYLGKKEDAMKEGRRAMELIPVASDPMNGPNLQEGCARVYLLVGEPEKALDLLGPLVDIPGRVSRELLAVDPSFESLRGNARFQRLVRGGRA